ncbi:MAG: hypothetical protein ACI4RL_06310 [Ruminococcus sp.]
MRKKCKKLLCILGVTGVAMMLLVVSSFMVSAEDITEAPPEEVVTDPPVVYTTAPPVYTQAPEPVYTTAPPVYTQAPETVYTDPPVYTQAPEEPVYQGEEYNNYQNDVESYSFYEEPVTEYENQAEYYDSESTSPTDNSSSLYNSGREIDDTELSKSNWKKIAEKLAQTKENDDEDSSPFDYIKNSDKATGLEAFFNNLNWAMTAAIVCFVLAVVCIVLFVVFTIKKKKGYAPKKGKKAKAGPQSSTKHSHASSHTDEDGYYVPSSRRSNSDYGDDFDESQNEKTVKKRAKQDTAEIIIPNKYKK